MGKISYRDFLKENKLPHHWCAGCGNGVVLQALSRAMADLQFCHNEVVLVSGIGCWGGADRYISVNAFHGTHGRALSFATGIKLANPSLHVIALLGDGDGVTIGGNHLIHTARRNIDITAVLVNNYSFGMTGGQYSATTPSGARTVTSLYGNPERPFDICKLTEVAGAPFVARGTVASPVQLKNMIKAALNKKGFSFVEVASICPTQYGRLNKLGDAIDMLKRLEANALSSKEMGELSEDEKAEKIAVGILVNKEIPDFNAMYSPVQESAVRMGQQSVMLQLGQQDVQNKKISSVNSKSIWQIVLAGSGGQGLIIGGTVLAQAAVIDGMNAAQTESYGAARRGGGSDSGVVIGSDNIAYPGIVSPDVVIALAKNSIEKYRQKFHSGSLVLCDSTLGQVDVPEGVNIETYPMTTIAKGIGGTVTPVNMVALGIMVKRTQVLSPDSILKAIDKCFSDGHIRENNKRAFSEGFNFIKD